MVVIVSAKRTPIGRLMGKLSHITAPQLGASAITAALANAKVKPKDVDEVIMGNALQAGVGQNPARQASIYAGLPDTVPAFTVNKVCGSGMKAVMLAADKIRLGEADIIVAGGMESMSKAPHLLRNSRTIKKYGDIKKKEIEKDFVLIDSMIYDGLWECMFGGHMGTLCANTVSKYKISREEQDEFSLESHKRAIDARQKFKEEIVEIKGVSIDEHPRVDTNLDKLSQLPVIFGKSITAGNASGLNDAGAALVIMSDKEAKKRKIKPLATIVDYNSAFLEPKWYTIAPVPAVKELLKRNKLKMNNIDLIEINEAYAGQTLAVQKDLDIPDSKLNVNGGAVALGHPIGASGARILVTLLHEMKRRNSKLGLGTLCIGGGGATAMLVKR